MTRHHTIAVMPEQRCLQRDVVVASDRLWKLGSHTMSGQRLLVGVPEALKAKRRLAEAQESLMRRGERCQPTPLRRIQWLW